MTDEELSNALSGLYAYDTGSRDSGIHDEALKARCIQAINDMPRAPAEIVPRLGVSRLIRDLFLSEEALAQGYGIEDVVSFTSWLDEQMMWGLVF